MLKTKYSKIKLTKHPISKEISDAIRPIIKYSYSHSNDIFFGLAPNILKIAISYNLSFLLTSNIPVKTITPDKSVIKAMELIIIISRFKIDLIAL